MGKKRFSPIRNLSKKNIENIPKNKPIVYKLKSVGNKNLYTGIAKRGRVDARLKEHLPGGPDPKKGTRRFQIKQFSSIEQARKEEKRIIKEEKPKLNK